MTNAMKSSAGTNNQIQPKCFLNIPASELNDGVDLAIGSKYALCCVGMYACM